MIIFCADIMTPSSGKSKTTIDGLEEEWSINYLSTFHLLSILSPAIRAQPPDRDVRIIFSTCPSYMGGTLTKLDTTEKPTKDGSFSYKRSKLALMIFIQSFQKHLDAYKRPDGQPSNTRTFIVDPGYSRTPGYRRWLTGGSLSGLMFYLITWPIWWLILKSPQQGAQTYLLSAMDGQLSLTPGGKFLKECGERAILRPEVKDEKVQKDLWEFSEKQIERLEKHGAVKRALAKKEAEEFEKKEKKKQQKKEKENSKTETSTTTTTTTPTSNSKDDTTPPPSSSSTTKDTPKPGSSRRSRKAK